MDPAQFWALLLMLVLGFLGVFAHPAFWVALLVVGALFFS